MYQVDLFTVRKKEVKCLATRLRGQGNSLPVVLENYSSRSVFTRRLLLILVMVWRATCSIKARDGLLDVLQHHVCVCV